MPHFNRFNQPYRCRVCGKSTSETQSNPDAAGVELCGPCYDRAGLENAHSDENHFGDLDNCAICYPKAKACGSFKASGNRAGHAPYNEGNEYAICANCGHVEGLHEKTPEAPPPYVVVGAIASALWPKDEVKWSDVKAPPAVGSRVCMPRGTMYRGHAVRLGVVKGYAVEHGFLYAVVDFNKTKAGTGVYVAGVDFMPRREATSDLRTQIESRGKANKTHDAFGVWHVVSDDAGAILGVYGEALVEEARSVAKDISARTYATVYVHHVRGERPSVGMSISMKGLDQCDKIETVKLLSPRGVEGGDRGALRGPQGAGFPRGVADAFGMRGLPNVEVVNPREVPTPGRSYGAEVIADESGEYRGNELRFATHSEAEAYAKDLYSRWTLVREWRVTEYAVDATYRFANGRAERIESGARVSP